MKKIIILFTLSIFLIGQSYAFESCAGDQDHNDRWERYRAEKVAFITTNLDLTPEEAQKFWPVYNQMEKERSEAQKMRRELEQKINDTETKLSDKEIIKLTREFAGSMEEEGKLSSKYNEKFLTILPPQKVLKLYQVENDFRMHMFKKFRDQRRKEGERP
ncbi:hypothetical protein [uncultured Draconibacterium sp.]|uniref:hypothetical protein n=1 Tax=uncultured Draconibacterium sp. TaxID=1573823 RepID=UPI003216935F